jgi:hypothetical protein
MYNTTKARHNIILAAYQELLQELKTAGKSNNYAHYEIAIMVAQRINNIYTSDYIYNVIYRPQIFEEQIRKDEQLQLF